jgi:hypothetical protein
MEFRVFVANMEIFSDFFVLVRIGLHSPNSRRLFLDGRKSLLEIIKSASAFSNNRTRLKINKFDANTKFHFL